MPGWGGTTIGPDDPAGGRAPVGAHSRQAPSGAPAFFAAPQIGQDGDPTVIDEPPQSACHRLFAVDVRRRHLSARGDDGQGALDGTSKPMALVKQWTELARAIRVKSAGIPVRQSHFGGCAMSASNPELRPTRLISTVAKRGTKGLVMRRTFVALAAVIGLAIENGGVAYGMGSNLTGPSISIPADPQTKEMDRVAQKIAEVLQAHKKRFTGGSFLNAHSVLYFGGQTAGVNALLGDLAKVEGATIRVRFSKEAGVTRWMFPGDNTPADRPCDCEIDHMGWGAARVDTDDLPRRRTR